MIVLVLVLGGVFGCGCCRLLLGGRCRVVLVVGVVVVFVCLACCVFLLFT